MNSGSRSRKSKLEPFSLEELANTTGMSGFETLLAHYLTPSQEPKTTPQPVDNTICTVVESTTVVDSRTVVETPTVVTTTTVVESMGRGRPDIDPTTVVESLLPKRPAKVQSIKPDVDIDPTTVVGSIGEGKQRRLIRRCNLHRDAHTPGQELLYQALWAEATPESGKSRKEDGLGPRRITIGWRKMASLTRMSDKNCKRNTQDLQRKLALEIIDGYVVTERIGTTYRIYGWIDLLNRRRAAGLQWVVRGKSVEFVDPATGVEMTTVVDTTTVPRSTTVVETTPGTGIETTPATVVETTTQSGIKKESSSSGIDDDDDVVYASARERIKAIFKAKAGDYPTVDLIDRLEFLLAGQGKTFEDYIEILQPHLGNHWKNPAGFLTYQVQNGFNQTLTRPVEREKPKCPRCLSNNGRGAILINGAIVACPDCSSPEWIKEFSEREAKRANRM